MHFSVGSGEMLGFPSVSWVGNFWRARGSIMTNVSPILQQSVFMPGKGVGNPFILPNINNTLKSLSRNFWLGHSCAPCDLLLNIFYSSCSNQLCKSRWCIGYLLCSARSFSEVWVLLGTSLVLSPVRPEMQGSSQNTGNSCPVEYRIPVLPLLILKCIPHIIWKVLVGLTRGQTGECTFALVFPPCLMLLHPPFLHLDHLLARLLLTSSCLRSGWNWGQHSYPQENNGNWKNYYDLKFHFNTQAGFTEFGFVNKTWIQRNYHFHKYKWYSVTVSIFMRWFWDCIYMAWKDYEGQFVSFSLYYCSFLLWTSLHFQVSQEKVLDRFAEAPHLSVWETPDTQYHGQTCKAGAVL